MRLCVSPGFARRLVGVAIAVWGVSACAPSPSPTDALDQALRALIVDSGGEASVYYSHLTRVDSLLIDPDVRMHAASTMKVPVMIQLYRDQEAGILSLDDSIEVTRTFHSIVDGSPFELDDGSDSELELYEQVGQRTTYRALNDLMITVSSNLATNILIAELDARRVDATAHELGADSIEVLRGVEDIPAFEAGLSNSTTARDLGVLMRALADGTAAEPESTREMIDVLLRQEFREKIPAGLPPATAVAHKTGNITRISHDAAIVRPGEDDAYVLVVLTRGFDDPDVAAALIAAIAELVDTHATA